MKLDEIKTGSEVFIDANIFIYHPGKVIGAKIHYRACKSFHAVSDRDLSGNGERKSYVWERGC